MEADLPYWRTKKQTSLICGIEREDDKIGECDIKAFTWFIGHRRTRVRVYDAYHCV